MRRLSKLDVAWRSPNVEVDCKAQILSHGNDTRWYDLTIQFSRLRLRLGTRPGARMNAYSGRCQDAEGEARFPPVEPHEWREVRRETGECGPRDDADYAFVSCERRP